MKWSVLGVCVLVVSVGRCVADLGEGEAIEEEEFYKCFRNIHCFNGDEVFDEFCSCYDQFGTEMYGEMFHLMRNASIESGKPIKTTIPDPYVVKREFCAMTEEEREGMFDIFILLIVEEFTDICSDDSTKDKCELVEKGLNCCFTLLERAAEEKQCELPEGVV